jgi:hypothetical protein
MLQSRSLEAPDGSAQVPSSCGNLLQHDSNHPFLKIVRRKRLPQRPPSSGSGQKRARALLQPHPSSFVIFSSWSLLLV